MKLEVVRRSHWPICHPFRGKTNTETNSEANNGGKKNSFRICVAELLVLAWKDCTSPTRSSSLRDSCSTSKHRRVLAMNFLFAIEIAQISQSTFADIRTASMASAKGYWG